MLNTLIVNSYDNGILWVGSQFDSFHNALRRLFKSCDSASSSYEALCHLEQCRISKKVFPLVLVEQSVTNVDRHTL